MCEKAKRMGKKRDGLPHQSADWFAMTGFGKYVAWAAG